MRPSHTVRTGLPTMMNEGDIVGHRMLRGRPVIVCGDGTSPWTLTRSIDLAAPFIRLFGNAHALGEDFHITSDRGYLWNDIYAAIAEKLGVKAEIVHVPTATLTRYHPAWEGPLMGDKTWTALFDNSKVKSVAGPFTCSEKLDEVLDESVAHFKKRLGRERPADRRTRSAHGSHRRGTDGARRLGYSFGKTRWQTVSESSTHLMSPRSK